MTAKQLPARGPNWYVINGGLIRPDTEYIGSRTGTANNGWRSKIKAGTQAGSAMTSDRYFVLERSTASNSGVFRRYIGPGNWDVQFQGSRSGYFTDLQYGEFPHALGLPSAEAEAQALTRMYDRIRQEAYGTNGLLFLGELKETIHMLKRPMEAIHKGVNQYLKTLKSTRGKVKGNVSMRRSETPASLNLRRLDAVKNAMAGSWLELQFGVKPLLNDVKEIAHTALDLATGPSVKHTRLRSKSTDAEKVIDVGAYLPSGAWMTWVDTRKRTRTKSGVQYVVGLRHSLDAPVNQLDRARTAFGFQWQNFVPTVYELLPWSFLIDYFVNFGDIIEAVCTDTSDVSWVVKTVRQDTTVDFTERWEMLSDPDSAGYPLWKCVSSPGIKDSLRKIRHLTVTRTVSSTLGIPPLVVSAPGADSTKWVNMAALLAGARSFRF